MQPLGAPFADSRRVLEGFGALLLFLVLGLGFVVEGLGFRVCCWGFRV